MTDPTFAAAAARLNSPEMGTEVLAPLLRDLVLFQRPRRILEIGAGLTTLYLLQALAEVEERRAAERGLYGDAAGLLNPEAVAAEPPPPVLHVIDNMVHPHTTAGRVAAEAADLGLDGPLRLHEADFFGFAEQLPRRDLPLDMIWFDCGHLDYFVHLRNAYWPLVNRNGGLILVHSLASNLHGQMFLSELKLEQATRSFNEFELVTLVEPHKKAQNSVTLIRLTGDLRRDIHSVMP